ncbi:ATP-binding cassette domain-containing protein [Actinoplanes sp. NPDC051851]|uniref:ATP-binding cassette domain-containing protein n=1 Tax=Actinoplanes sp. NPDC051851 TaxID=3154753 RepID=UPI003424B9C1
MRLEGVWFRYTRRADWALREVDATVEPGQTIVVLGRNGAGKSTLLQLAADVLRPVRGAVRDRPRVVGWVPERFPADQPFTALGYLHAMAALRGLRPAAADPWIERLSLGPHTGTSLNALSKGTAQKVGLAQALLTPPGLLVLDEPWEGLDAEARTLIPRIVAEVTAAGGAVLVSDHRGEIAGLPDAIHWSVSGGTLDVTVPEPVTVGATPAEDAAWGTGALSGPPDPGARERDEVVVEISVPRAEAAAAVVRLRADGHRVLGVREEDRK